MKYNVLIIKTYIIFFIIYIVFSNSYIPSYAISNSDNMRACWISYLDIEQHLKGLDEESFRKEVGEMYDNVLANSLNTVIVQVRSMADAIYPSDYFPWSIYITDNREAPSYDPLAIMIEIAREKNLRFEAWLNPYRISLNNTGTNSFKVTSFYEEYKYFIMEYSNAKGESCLSFDPAKEETVELITAGVEEILKNYDVDGIHYDDYFYVSGMADQLDVSLKKEYVNNMVKATYDTIKEIDSTCELGISPAGNIDNARNQGADVDTWLSVEGYIDYIMPQIYWTDMFVTGEGNKTMFTDRCKEWQAINLLNLPMYIGLALYRVGEESQSDIGWSIKNTNLAEQYDTAISLGCDGYALFRYEWLELSFSKEELENLLRFNKERFKYFYICDAYISYSVCNSDGLWHSAKKDGIKSGKTGCPIQGIVMDLGKKAGDGNVTYRVMFSDMTWSTWCVDGTLCFASQDIVDMQIILTGHISSEYSVMYRCKRSDGVWTEWASDGASISPFSSEKNVEGVQIKLVKKS